MSIDSIESTKKSSLYTRMTYMEQRKSRADIHLGQESRAELAKKVELFLCRSNRMTHAKERTNRYERNVLNYLDKWWKPRTHFNDNADVSLHPSYNFTVYDTDCEERYRAAKKKYHEQFQREMEHLIANQPNMGEQYYLKRILCYKTSWPPLHTKQELNNFVTKFFQLTPKEKRRVDYLMKTDLSKGC